jgi:hypothetical protein
VLAGDRELVSERRQHGIELIGTDGDHQARMLYILDSNDLHSSSDKGLCSHNLAFMWRR